MKIGFYRYFIADILTKVLQKYSLSDPLQNIHFLLLPLNLVGYQWHGKNSRIRIELLLVARSNDNHSPGYLRSCLGDKAETLQNCF